MRLQLWLTKDPSFGDPVPINEVAERGRYVVFDYVNWQRESVSISSPIHPSVSTVIPFPVLLSHPLSLDAHAHNGSPS